MNESEALDEMVLNHRSHPMACYYRSLVGVCQASTVLKERRGSKMDKDFHEHVLDGLRGISERIKDGMLDPVHFPELNLQNEQELRVFRAASTIAKEGNLDGGHKVDSLDLAALIHYIADMME